MAVHNAYGHVNFLTHIFCNFPFVSKFARIKIRLFMLSLKQNDIIGCKTWYMGLKKEVIMPLSND